MHNTFFKTETKFIMTLEGELNDLANTWKILKIAFSKQTSYRVLKTPNKVLKKR